MKAGRRPGRSNLRFIASWSCMAAVGRRVHASYSAYSRARAADTRLEKRRLRSRKEQVAHKEPITHWHAAVNPVLLLKTARAAGLGLSFFKRPFETRSRARARPEHGQVGHGGPRGERGPPRVPTGRHAGVPSSAGGPPVKQRARRDPVSRVHFSQALWRVFTVDLERGWAHLKSLRNGVSHQRDGGASVERAAVGPPTPAM